MPVRGMRLRRAYILSAEPQILGAPGLGVVPNAMIFHPVPSKKFSSRASQGSNDTVVHRRHMASPALTQGWICKYHQRHLYCALFDSLPYPLSRSMSFDRRRKSSPFKSAIATSLSTKQLPPPQLLPSTPESQSHSSQQQQQAQPNHPWSVLRPASHNNDVPSSMSPSPFLRFGHTLSITAAGELLSFGGFAHGSVRNDLYVFSMRNRSVTFLKTSGEVPSPRGILASVLVSNILLIFGGTNMDVDNRGFFIGPYDDSLYLLSLGMLNFFDIKAESS